jgi:hypothetical protein
VSVLAGQTVSLETAPIDLYGVQANWQLVADIFHTPSNVFYMDCLDADEPDLAYDVYDSFDTLILSDIYACRGSTPLPVTLYSAGLDLDNYTVRIAGYLGASTTQTYDSCTVAFDHFGSGASTIDLTNIVCD